MLTDSPIVRSLGALVLFLAGAVVNVAILLWIQHLLVGGNSHGLTTIFLVLFANGDYGATVCALLILILAVAAPRGTPARKIFLWTGGHPALVTAASLVALICGSLGIYHSHPLSMDEYAAYFQSQVFAAGHLSGQFPPPLMDWLIPPGFQDFFLNVSHVTGQVASTYWPGYALIMTPFTFIGMPWACNPILSALTLLVVHRLAVRIFADTEAAGLALLLTLASPVFFGIGISYYSMPAHLLANSLYALMLVSPTPRKAFVAGVVGSIALSLHNPLPHMAFALPWLIWIVIRQDRIRVLAALCAGYLPLCGLLGVGWFEFSNHLHSEGQGLIVAGAGAGVRFENMLTVFSMPNWTVLLSRSIGLAKLWAWAVPGLLILACFGAARGRANITCRLLGASAVSTLLAYLFFPQDQGHGWGYRYFHSAWIALPLLAAAAIYRPARSGDTREDPATSAFSIFAEPAAKSYLAACIFLTLVFGVGVRAWQIQRFMAEDLSQLPHYQSIERHVVLIDTRFSFYGADLVQNDPWLRRNEVRMFSHGVLEDGKMLAQYFPTWRRVYADRFGTVWAAGN